MTSKADPTDEQQFRGQVAVTRRGLCFGVELRITKPDGSREVIDYGTFDDCSKATEEANKVHEKMLSVGGKPTTRSS